MVDRQIEGLTATATLATTDLLVGVDVSDTSDPIDGDAGGTTKQFTLATLNTFLGSTTQTLTNKTINTASNTITVVEADISDLQAYITASSTDTLTNKTIDLGTNTLTGTKAEFDTACSDGDFLYVGDASNAVTALNTAVESRMVTIGSTTTELDGEANVTYDGTTFVVSDDAKIVSDGGPVLRVERTTTLTTGSFSACELLMTTTADMVDDFGPRFQFGIKDSAGTNNPIGHIRVNRDGADNSGRIQLHTFTAGSAVEGLRVDSSQNVTIPAGNLTISGFGTAEKGVVITGPASHTASLQEWNPNGVTAGRRGRIDQVGRFRCDFGVGTNTFMGACGNINVTGADNTAVGNDSLSAISSGTKNSAIGSETSKAITTGSENMSLGWNANAGIVGGSHNVALGSRANDAFDTSEVVAVGRYALTANQENQCCAVGNKACWSATTAARTSAFGSEVGLSLTTGDDNCLFGHSAGATTLTTGSANIILGRAADVNAAGASNNFVAGSGSAPINDVYFGKGMVNATPTAYTLNSTGGSGTNIAGADLRLAGGKGTGTGAGGHIKFQTAKAGVSGSSLNTLATIVEIADTTPCVTITPQTVTDVPLLLNTQASHNANFLTIQENGTTRLSFDSNERMNFTGASGALSGFRINLEAVSHPFTALASSTTSGLFQAASATAGGMLLAAYSETGQTALIFQARNGSTGSAICCTFEGSKSDGATNDTDLGANDAIVRFTNHGTHKVQINGDGSIEVQADITTDTALADDTTRKKFSIQKLASAPTNAGYIAFSNNPGTDTFYLVLEEG